MLEFWDWGCEKKMVSPFQKGESFKSLSTNLNLLIFQISSLRDFVFKKFFFSRSSTPVIEPDILFHLLIG
jgi:hypothetical protein